MRALLILFRAFDIRHIGSCPTCLRVSFFTMVSSWLFLVASLSLGLAVPPLADALPVLFSLLWLAHVVRRATLSVRHDQLRTNSTRRVALRFALAVMGAAAVSVAFPWEARADSGCGGWAGNSGCEPCSNYGVARCMRQNSSCGCYYCRSCGSDCGDNVC